MAELVQLNMEQMLPFFDELNKIFGQEYVKEVVSKRQHYEYKIASKKRNFDDFHNYVKFEMKNFNFIKNSKFTDLKGLLKAIKLLIRRLLTQITTHFQKEPRAFLLAIKICRTFHITHLEQKYWDLLLKKHGYRNVKFYITAAYYAMHEMLKSDMENKDRQKLKDIKELTLQLKEAKDNPSKYEELKKAIEDIEIDSEQSKMMASDNYRSWSRDVYSEAHREFPNNRLLHIAYFKFEINNYHFQQNATEDQRKIFGDCKDGRVLEILLNQRLSDGSDVSLMAEMIALMDAHVPSFQSEALEHMRTLVAAAAESEPQAMIVDEAPLKPTADIDAVEYFLKKYPNPKEIRAISPIKAATDLVRYLEALITKLCSGELSKEEELPRVRALLEWVLNDDDWSHKYIDVWWQYYEVERRCGDYFKSMEVLQRAASKLAPDMQAILTLRKIKALQTK